MKVYYRNSNNNIFTVNIKLDETMKVVAAKIQDKDGLNPFHVSVTMVNNACDCVKRIEHLLLESLDNPIEIEIDSGLEIDNAIEDSFPYVNRLYEGAKLKQVKNEVLGDLRNELKTIIENPFKESYDETSRHKQNNDDIIALLKEEIEYLKEGLMEKNKVISNLIRFCKSSSGSLQDNSSPWLPVDTSSENIGFTLHTPPKCLNLNTPSQSMLKETRTNAGEIKRKSTLDKQFKLKLSNIYSKKLPKSNLEKQLNTIRKRNHASYTNNIVKKLLNKNTNSQSNSNSSYKYENTTAQKLATQQKKRRRK